MVIVPVVDDLCQEARFQQGSWNLKDGQDVHKQEGGGRIFQLGDVESHV